MEIKFTVPAIPVAQPRQRHRVATINGRAMSMNYTPAKDPVNNFKATVKMAAAQVLQGPPMSGPLRVDLVFVFPRQKAKVWKSKPMPRYFHVGKPDRDNLAKSLQDALNGLAWVDDAQICAGSIEKYHAAGDEQPHCLVTIKEIEAEPTLFRVK